MSLYSKLKCLQALKITISTTTTTTNREVHSRLLMQSTISRWNLLLLFFFPKMQEPQSQIQKKSCTGKKIHQTFMRAELPRATAEFNWL